MAEGFSRALSEYESRMFDPFDGEDEEMTREEYLEYEADKRIKEAKEEGF